ncbi:MAG TPA: DUF2892 domain-containing protein [Bacteroidia bacterium]|nr:DUF2892 domain-containing protein [Bacteroidia bacterium]
MKKNVGSIDRMIRLLAALAIIVLYYTNQISGTVAIVLLGIAGIFIITSFVSVCPIYLMFGLSTKNKKAEA